MKLTSDTKTLRLLFLILYCFLILIFCSWTAYQAWQHYRNGRDEYSRTAQKLDRVRACGVSFNRIRALTAETLLTEDDRARLEILHEIVWRAGEYLRQVEDLEKDPQQNILFTAAQHLKWIAQSSPVDRVELQNVVEENLRAYDALEQQTLAAYRAGNSPDDDYFFRTAIRFGIFLIVATALLIAGNMILTWKIRSALRTLSAGTKELRNGNLDYRFQEITPDEIGGVKYDFNLMARRLHQQSAELHKVNAELRQQAEKLLEAHQHKDRFLTNMSHELRTPLNAIIGFSELIEARAEHLPPEKLRSYSSRILTAAGHLLSLITALLDMAKSNVGTLTAKKEDFDLSLAIREMCDMLSPLAEKKKLSVTLEITDGLQIHADPKMIRQIFINIFSNAVKYTFEGGITVRLYRAGKETLLEIADTGIGIAEEDQKKLFQDFYRVESAAAVAVDGVGIGLALSRRLAALNNGSIRFVSRENEGSTFTLVLK